MFSRGMSQAILGVQAKYSHSARSILLILHCNCTIEIAISPNNRYKIIMNFARFLAGLAAICLALQGSSAQSLRSSRMRNTTMEQGELMPDKFNHLSQENKNARGLQTNSFPNPERVEVRSCKRVWYKPWKKECKTKTKKCYKVHRYKYSCYGVLGVEKFYYPKNGDWEKIGNFKKYTPCVGLKFKGSGCFDYAGIESNVCPKKWGVSGQLPNFKTICD